MDPLQKLVNSDPSYLSRLGQALVAGSIAALESGVAAFPDDPAVEKARLAIAYLKDITSRAATEGKGLGQAKAPDAEARRNREVDSSHGSFDTLLQSWNRTSEWDRWIGKIKHGSSEELPRVLWLLTHRLPPEIARTWQHQWSSIARIAESPQGEILVAGPEVALLCPQLPNGSRPVKMTPQAQPDSRLISRSTSPLVQRMAIVSSAVLWFLDNDPMLIHAWSAVNRFGISPLTESQRNRYRDALINRFQSLQEADERDDCNTLVTAWVELDEAIHSLFYEAVPHPESTFSRLATASRDCIRLLRQRVSNPGLSFHIQVPNGLYSGARGLSDPDFDVEVSSGGMPGEIVRCLRVYLKINGDVTLARLAYRPK